MLAEALAALDRAVIEASEAEDRIARDRFLALTPRGSSKPRRVCSNSRARAQAPGRTRCACGARRPDARTTRRIELAERADCGAGPRIGRRRPRAYSAAAADLSKARRRMLPRGSTCGGGRACAAEARFRRIRTAVGPPNRDRRAPTGRIRSVDEPGAPFGPLTRIARAASCRGSSSPSRLRWPRLELRDDDFRRGRPGRRRRRRKRDRRAALRGSRANRRCWS